MQTPIVAAVAAATALLATPPFASAATISVEGGVPRIADSAGVDDQLVAGVRDDSSVGHDAPFYVLFTDIADPAVTVGPGCADNFLPACPFGVTPPASAAVDMGAGNDSLRFAVRDGARTAAAILLGAGDDAFEGYFVHGSIDGGDGDDTIVPDDRGSVLVPQADASPGTAIAGGAGTDTISYEDTLSPIDVSLDGKANDGQPSEGDNIAADFENIVGSGYGGTLTGTAAANAITGGGGDDRVVGGAGRDTLGGGGGNDTVDALDAAPGDRVDCGDGADVAYLDAGDLQAESACEKLVWAPGLGKLRWRGGRVVATLKCPKRGGACRGTLRLTSTGGKSLGRAGYRIKAGKRVRVRIKPTRRVERRAVGFVEPRGVRVSAGRTVTVRR